MASDFVNKLISIVPNKRQLKIQDMGFYCFIHYGMTTFTGKEWGNGKTPPSTFNPKNQNTDQWCEAIKASGAKGIIFTAKHHDGFCLWQTQTTEYSVKNSPYKNGNGDVCKELSDSCKKYGLKFGIYISPWDRNSKYYGTPQYDDFYCSQLNELLTNYGELFCMWFDGACGAALDGKSKQPYDFKRYFKFIHSIQPDCALSICGTDIRWVGNEAGKARESEWCVVPRQLTEAEYISELSQQDVNDAKRLQKVTSEMQDIGSREFLSKFDEYTWYPAEVDVSIHKGWFYHRFQKPKSLDTLIHIYNTSVGGNSTLLLNVPPSKKGIIEERDAIRLKELGNYISDAFKNKILTDSYREIEEKDEYVKEIKFDSPATVKRVVLKEDTDYSQRVEKFTIEFYLNDVLINKKSSTVIGFNKFVLVDSVTADKVKLTITECRSYPVIKEISFYG